MGKSVLYIVYSALLMVSWLTSAIGLKAGLPFYFAFPIAFVIVAGTGYFAPRLLPRFGRLGQSVLAWVGYPLVAGLSILFATAFFYSMMAGKEYLEDEIARAGAGLLAPLGALEEYYRRLDGMLDELATYSRKQADLESRQGGTCDPRSRRGKGAYWALRQWQAREFESLAADFGHLQAEVQAAIGQARSIVTGADRLAALRALQLEMKRLLVYFDHPMERQLREKLRRYADHTAGRWPNDPVYCYEGRCFQGRSCKDTRLLGRLRQIAAMQPPPKPALELDVQDPDDLGQMFTRATALWSQWLAGEEVKPYEAKAMAWGVMIDALVLIFGFAVGLGSRSRVTHRLDRKDFERLSEHFAHLVRLYPRVFGGIGFDPGDSTPGGRMRLLHAVVDEVTRPAGEDRVILLPLAAGRLRSKGQVVLSADSEARLEAVQDVARQLGRHRLLFEPGWPPLNRHREFMGYDTAEVAHWYGLSPAAVDAFRVLGVTPELTTDLVDGYLLERSPLAPHLAIIREFLACFRPGWVRAAEDFERAPERFPPPRLAEILLSRLSGIRKEAIVLGMASRGRRERATVTLFPQIFALDERLERMLLDDDFGLHEDVEDITPLGGLWHWIRPYRSYELGPCSLGALRRLVDSGGGPAAGTGRQGPPREEPGADGSAGHDELP